jgi:hypothetical protein
VEKVEGENQYCVSVGGETNTFSPIFEKVD